MILILTAGFGDGHNTAARSVGEAIRAREPGEKVEVVDLISDTHPLVARTLSRLYQFAITSLPSAWGLAFKLLEKTGTGSQAAAWQLALLNRLAAIITKEKPRAIVSTYPLYSCLIAALREQMIPPAEAPQGSAGVSPVHDFASRMSSPPLVTVITDSISVHPVWVAAPSDHYCVADEETKEVVAKLGVPAEKITVTGFPVSLAFAMPQPAASDAKAHRILYLPSTTISWFAKTLEALRPQLRAGLHLTIPVGKHGPRLYHALTRFTDSMPQARIEIIGWTNRMPELLRAHDAVICKAGGAILHEVLAARIPAVIDYVVPGQEEGNAEYLLSRDCALRSHSPAETAAHIAKLLADNCKLAREMSEKMRPFSVPDAAMRVAGVVDVLPAMAMNSGGAEDKTQSQV